MIKTILFDCDGPVIKRGMYFTHRLISEHAGIDLRKILPFFEGRFPLCQIGKADLKKELKKVLPEWGYKGTVEELMDYWFRHEANVNMEMIDYIDGLRSGGIRCFLVTNNEKYRVQYLFEVVGLKKHFDDYFGSCDLGYIKAQGEFWASVQKSLGDIKPSEVLLLDDDEKNVESGKAFGFKAELYNTFNTSKKKIDKYLNTV